MTPINILNCDNEYYPLVYISKNIKDGMEFNPTDEYLKSSVLEPPKLILKRYPFKPNQIETTTKKISYVTPKNIMSILVGVWFVIWGISFLLEKKPSTGLGVLMLCSGIIAIIFGFSIEDKIKLIENKIDDIKFNENLIKYEAEFLIIDNENKIIRKEYNKLLFDFNSKYQSEKEYILNAYHIDILKPLSLSSRLNLKSQKHIMGRSELQFLEILLQYFSEEVKTGVSLGPFQPDFAITRKYTNLCIDIEIDEPYDLQSKSPIHYIDIDIDADRNQYFLEQNWIIIRFSERQILNEAQNCLQFIIDTINCIEQKQTILSSSLTKSKRWTYEESLIMMKNSYRS